MGTVGRNRAITASASRAIERTPLVAAHAVDLTDPSGASWANPQVVLYHGTDADAASDIRKQVHLPENSVRAGGWDFGRGFYMSVTSEAAQDWALQRAGRRGADPVIVEILVDRVSLSKLAFIVFPDPAPLYSPLDPFWQYVHFCRSRTSSEPRAGRSGEDRSALDPYDIAMGPTAFLPRDPRRPPYIEGTSRPRLIQVCFKTDSAIALLNASPRTLIGLENPSD
jgi:hypothetical protein